MKMRFGKFRGSRIEDLPDDYLEWLASIDLREPLKTTVEMELASRQEPSGRTMKMAAELVTAGYRVLALKHHPDHGGDTAMMQLVNRAAGWLRGRVRELTQ
jgi:uncharacterized protein (DUF3820 family)